MLSCFWLYVVLANFCAWNFCSIIEPTIIGQLLQQRTASVPPSTIIESSFIEQKFQALGTHLKVS